LQQLKKGVINDMKKKDKSKMSDDDFEKLMKLLHQLLCDIELLGIERGSSSSNTPDLLVIKDKRTDNTFKIEATCLNSDTAFYTELLKNHCTFCKDFVEDVRDCINDSYEKLLIAKDFTTLTDTLGWFQHGDDDLFILSKEQECNGHKYISTRDDFEFQDGNADEYQRLLDEVVYPNENMSLALTIGYSAVVVARLKDIGFGSLLFNFSGVTSTGKTTVEKLLVSPFASPTTTGLIQHFNATLNALYAQLTNINGVPICFDDISANESINSREMIYSMADGKPKQRCTTDGLLTELSKAGWSGVIVISSENSILDNANGNQGLLGRVLSVDKITWTPDAATAERIQRTVAKNYGFTGAAFAEFVKQIPIDDLYARYEQARQDLPQIISNEYPFKERLEKQYAAIFLTVQLVNECFNQQLNAEKLIEILLNAEAASLEEYMPEDEKALLHIKQFFLENRLHFYDTFYSTDDDYLTSNGSKFQYYGRFYTKENDTVHLYVLVDVLNQVLKKHRIKDITAVRKKWRADGRTVCDKGRTSTKARDQNGMTKCYVHFVFEASMGDDLSWMEYPHPEVEDVLANVKTANENDKATTEQPLQADNDDTATAELQQDNVDSKPVESSPPFDYEDETMNLDSIDFEDIFGGDTDNE